MLNLYANAEQRGFMGLIANSGSRNDKEMSATNRRIISGFAILSILILSVIANGSQYQLNFDVQKQSVITSNKTSAI